MSVKGLVKDLMILSIIISLITFTAYTLYAYFTTLDVKYLYLGLLLGVLTLFGALARYRWLFDYIKTLFDKWR